MIIRRDTNEKFDEVTASRLLVDVFGFDANHNKIDAVVSKALFYHWTQQLNDNPQLSDETDFGEINSSSVDACELIQILKSQTDKTLSEIYDALRSKPPSWMGPTPEAAKIDISLKFAASLWLFTKLDLRDQGKSFRDAVHQPLNAVKKSSNETLWEDFSARTLEDRAGFRFQFTNNIGEHLTFVDRHVIRVFGYSRALDRYKHPGNVESKMYPDGMLDELGRTMNLLWPWEDPPTRKHARRLQKRCYVDLEAGMGYEDKFDLTTYQFFGARLANIQSRFEAEEERKSNRKALSIAVLGILLTAFFGFVSAGTGIASMWAGLKQVGEVQ